MIDPIKPQVLEHDALAVTRKLVQKVDVDPKLQRAIQKAVKQLRKTPDELKGRVLGK